MCFGVFEAEHNAGGAFFATPLDTWMPTKTDCCTKILILLRWFLVQKPAILLCLRMKQAPKVAETYAL